MISSSIKLSDYFTVGDLIPTSTGIPNNPSTQKELDSLKKLANVLDEIQSKVGPFRIASGYRAPLVNAAVGGSNTSRHMTGEAVDIIPTTKTAEKYWVDLLSDPTLRELLGEISYKKPQGSIHLSLPYTSSMGLTVIGSARLADGSPMVYRSLTPKQEEEFFSKYGLFDENTYADLQKYQAGIASTIQNLFSSTKSDPVLMGKTMLILGGGVLSLALLVKSLRKHG